ncbi:DUF2559 family protein [Marinobacterium sp. AK62]|uniref:DUF2559 family protein n=1 Tax=Marinobacterium alkalitolerans TaxID=1542925 RepID=A0ABS3Z8Z5_9GAMM|nr:YhfG family protein [Marinobacterium alkalitolerans]MBP0047474.1 DUF2559 family protein [Marinobacterium alkalitolerans]
MKQDAHAVKAAYFSRVRRRNYKASLRLEGFDMTQTDQAPTSKAEAIRHHTPKAAS